MTIVGYARVSSLGQDLTVQLEKLSGCDKMPCQPYRRQKAIANRKPR